LVDEEMRQRVEQHKLRENGPYILLSLGASLIVRPCKKADTPLQVHVHRPLFEQFRAEFQKDSLTPDHDRRQPVDLDALGQIPLAGAKIPAIFGKDARETHKCPGFPQFVDQYDRLEVVLDDGCVVGQLTGYGKEIDFVIPTSLRNHFVLGLAVLLFGLPASRFGCCCAGQLVVRSSLKFGRVEKSNCRDHLAPRRVNATINQPLGK
jgi:hypothetical protein